MLVMLVLLVLASLQVGSFPALVDGSEVRLVSRDLLTVHGTGRVEEGVLRLEGTLEPGAELRLLVFAPDGPEAAASEPDAAEDEEGEAGGWWARVTPDGRDLMFREPGAPAATARSLREHLWRDHGIELQLLRGPS